MVRQQLLRTPSGPVEFAIEGNGPPILYFHGTPCGNELMLEWERALVESGFQLIIPHRPGFYGTPLAGRTSTAQCADMAALVLDYVGVDRVTVIGTSAGGPMAMAFAIRFPHRTAALVLQCAQVHRWDDVSWAPPGHPWLYHVFRFGASRWSYCQLFPVLFRIGFPTPKHYLKDLSGARYLHLQENREALELVISAHRTVKRFRAHRQGYYNDLSTWFREDVLHSGEITSPTLLLYDPLDPCVPFCHAEYAASLIRRSNLLELHAGGHLLGFGRDAELMEQERDIFLRQHAVTS